MSNENAVFAQQGFGASLGLLPPFGLLLIDFVNSFADPNSFGGGNIAAAIEHSQGLLEAARQRGWPIAHSRIVYQDDGSDANIFSAKVPTMISLKEDSPGSQIVPELTPRPGEYVVRKNVPSAFFATDLAPWLTSRGVKTLIVGGAVTSGCVRASVVDAMCWGFRPIVVSDCVGDRAIAPHDASLFDMRQKYADVMTRNELLAGLPA